MRRRLILVLDLFILLNLGRPTNFNTLNVLIQLRSRRMHLYSQDSANPYPAQGLGLHTVFAGWPLHGSLSCGSSGVLQSMGSQRVRHDLVTEQQLAGWRGTLGDPVLSFGMVPGL